MLDFPASPSAGQIFVAPNGVTYQWSSTYTAWLPLNVTSAGVGDFCAYRSSTITLPGSYATLLYDTVLSGNSGGWYSTSTGRFTPPAGRYCLYVCFTGTYSAVNTANIALRKNGTIFMTAASTVAGNTYMASAPLTATVDANGTDYFDVVGYSGTAGITSGSGNSFFGAFPISAAGPAAGTGSSWRQIARVVPTAGQATVDFQNVPADINDLQMRFDVTPTANTQDAILQFFDNNGIIDTTSGHYGWALAATSSAQATGTAPAGAGSTTIAYTSGVLVDYSVTNRRVGNVSGVRGRATVNNIKDAARPKNIDFQTSYVTDDATQYLANTGSGVRSTVGAITGIRLSFSATTFAAGGAVSLWGSP